MNDKKYHLIKKSLLTLGPVVYFVPIYFVLDNKALALSGVLLLAIGSIVWGERNIVRDYRADNFEVIYNGFNFRGQMFMLTLLVLLIFLIIISDVYTRFFVVFLVYGLIWVVAGGFKVITFDLNKKEITRLFDNERRKAGQLMIEYLNEDNCPRIKIVDYSGFFELDKKDFSDNNWSRLLANLERLQIAKAQQQFNQ